MAHLRTPANLFEQASIDEAYLDVTDTVEGDWDAALALAKTLQQTITDDLGLTASFGIGPTRIIAKMSSEVNKPNGIFRVMPDEVSDFFLAAVPYVRFQELDQNVRLSLQSGDLRRLMNCMSWVNCLWNV